MIQAKTSDMPRGRTSAGTASVYRAVFGAIWLRHRRLYITTGWISLVSTLSASALHFAVMGIADPITRSGFESIGDLLFSVLLFLGIWRFAMEIVTGRQEGDAVYGTYPVNMFVLPLRTREIVLVPLAIEVTGILAFATLFWLGAVVPLRIQVPVMVPVLALLSIVPAGQASAWVVRWKGSLGCVLMVLMLVLPLACTFAVGLHVPELWVAWIPVAMIVISLVSSLAVASSVRHSLPHGQLRASEGKKDKWSSADERRLAAIGSPFSAQIWILKKIRVFERMFAFLVGLAVFALLVRIALSQSNLVERLGIGEIMVSPATNQFLIAIPAYLVLAYACGFASTVSDGLIGKAGAKGMNPFQAIRPIHTRDIFLARLRPAFDGCVLGTLVILVGLGLCMLAPAVEHGRDAMLGQLLLAHCTVRGALAVAVIIGLYPFLALSAQATKMGFDLSTPRFQKIVSVGRYVLVFIAFWGIIWYSKAGSDRLQKLVPFLIALGLALLVVKGFLAVTGSKRLLQLRLVDQPTLMTWAKLWLVSEAVLTVCFSAFFRFDLLPSVSSALFFALALPVNRILWQILGLDSTRHQ